MVPPIHYPIAKDENGKWVKIVEAQRGRNYFCPECESPFVLRLGLIRVHHFAHKSGYQGECTGESGYHNLAKHLLAYHFEEKGHITLSSKCPECSREFSEEKKIIGVQVEKGSDDYRPDVKLLLAESIVVDCEVVYKNPLGDKLNLHMERKANLLVWEIDKYEKHLFRNKLLLLASPVTPKHICSPYGIAYVSEMDCYKCHSHIKVAQLIFWYPRWIDQNDGHSYIPFRSVPSQFLSKLNKQYGTNLGEDFSYTVNERYVMNHCGNCHAKIGDFYLHDAESEKRVCIDFKLTPWEKKAFEKWQAKGR